MSMAKYGRNRLIQEDETTRRYQSFEQLGSFAVLEPNLALQARAGSNLFLRLSATTSDLFQLDSPTNIPYYPDILEKVLLEQF